MTDFFQQQYIRVDLIGSWPIDLNIPVPNYTVMDGYKQATMALVMLVSACFSNNG